MSVAMLIKYASFIIFLPRLLVVFVFLLVCGFTFSPWHNQFPAQYTHRSKPNTLMWSTKNITKTSSTFGSSAKDFWKDLAKAIIGAQPYTSPLTVEDGHPSVSETAFEPLKADKKYPQRLVKFTEKDETALLKAHHHFRTSARRIGPQVPFVRDSSGIVTTANAKYMPTFLVSLRMLRRTGCELPVEVFIENWAKYDADLCETVLPSLNARCVVLSAIYDTARTVAQPSNFQYKIFAILFSSFQHVLFLDSDVFPVSDPSILFSSRPYTTHGLVLWPDLFALTISEHFYHIAAIAPEPVNSRLSTESGQVMINKDRQRESLLMMVYYNYYGPGYYYPLLCQGSHGAGDKETFVQAAMAVNLPWYQVKIGAAGLGRWENNEFRMSGLAQADPSLDFKYPPPHQSHIHAEAHWKTEEIVIPDSDEATRNRTLIHPSRRRPLFVHQNMWKLDPKRILNKGSTARDKEGRYTRMWGSEEVGIRMFGYDVERALWDVIALEGCSGAPSNETCRNLQDYISEVFR